MNTLSTSAIDLCNVFIAKCIKETSQRESIFWWKHDVVLHLKLIHEQLEQLKNVQNLAFAVALVDSICSLAYVVCEYSGDENSAGLFIIMEELLVQVTKEHEIDTRKREERLKLAPFKPSKRRKAA